MEDHVVGRGSDPTSVRARELVHELITAHIFTEKPDFSVMCSSIGGELLASDELLKAYLEEAAAYTHTVLSAIASGLDSEHAVDDDTVGRFHRAMIAAWSKSEPSAH